MKHDEEVIEFTEEQMEAIRHLMKAFGLEPDDEFEEEDGFEIDMRSSRYVLDQVLRGELSSTADHPEDETDTIFADILLDMISIAMVGRSRITEPTEEERELVLRFIDGYNFALSVARDYASDRLGIVNILSRLVPTSEDDLD